MCDLPATFEFSEKLCDGKDNDCDGRVDAHCTGGDDGAAPDPGPDTDPDTGPAEGQGEGPPFDPPFGPPRGSQGCCTQAAPGSSPRQGLTFALPRR